MKQLDELMDILQREYELFNDVLNVSTSKTRMIIENKVAELDALVKTEHQLIFQMGRLEDEREAAILKIVDALGINPSDIDNITALAPKLDKEDAARLKELQNKLGVILSQIRTKNDANAKLIRNSLEYINFSINVMADMSLGANNYGSQGELGEAKKRNLFDLKL